MKRVIVIGGGIAGLSAARALCRVERRVCDVTVIDKRHAQQNLPLLPELVGHPHDPAAFQYPLAGAAQREGFLFCHEEVVGIDLSAQKVSTTTQTLSYDYLLLATGTQTHLRQMAPRRHDLLTLDSAADAVTIRERIVADAPANIIIAGGSYTGVEIATQLQCAMKRADRGSKILLLNRRDRTCHSLPPWMSRYVEKNLQAMGIDVRHGTTLDGVDGKHATLSTGEQLENTICIWTAGVTPPELVGQLGLPLTSGGRLESQRTLRITDNVFAAGDTSGYQQKGEPVRMSVQFAVMSGRSAAANIVRSITNTPLRTYRHVDLGYVIPLANNRGCGMAMGIPIRGPLTMLLHYGMGLYRTFGWRQRTALFKAITQQKRVPFAATAPDGATTD